MDNWINTKGIDIITFDDGPHGGYVVKVKKMREGQWIGQIALPGQGRWDGDTRLGEWTSLEEAKDKVLQVLRARPWCPQCCK